MTSQSKTDRLFVLDGRALCGHFTGDRTYWRGILTHLPQIAPAHQFVALTRLPIEPGLLPQLPNLTVRTIYAANERVWLARTFPAAARAMRASVLHTQYTIPLPGMAGCPIYTSVHDVSFRLHPEWFPLKHRLLMNLTVGPSMRMAAHVLTISESSRQDILRLYRLPPHRVTVATLGVEGVYAPCYSAQQQAADLAMLQTRFALQPPYVLAVGVLQPRKNLSTLIAGFSRFCKSNPNAPHKLALTGKSGWGESKNQMLAAAREIGGQNAADRIVFTGYAEDEQLPPLYRQCAAFAYPSLYEGFGLPPLEAMACGAPVLVSNRPAMTEVTAGAAMQVEAEESGAWAQALQQVLLSTGLQAEMRARGFEKVRQYTWEKTAQVILQAYQLAFSSHK